MALFSFFFFFLPKCASEFAISEERRRSTAGDKANERKGTQGNKKKEVKKSVKKSAFIPYLDNIETTLMKIFHEMSILWGFDALFLVNRFFSVIGSTFSYDRILIVVRKREIGGLSFSIKLSLGGVN